VRLVCAEDELRFDTTVTGAGRLDVVRLLGGRYSGNPRWGGGRFHSRWPAQTLFDPSPDDPRRIVAPAAEPATIGAVGGALPGRGHWFFTPASLLFAGHAERDADPHSAAGWTTLEVLASIDVATFSEVRYAPFLGGWSLELAYDGETVVDGTFTTPAIALRLDVADPYQALADHAERLRMRGMAPRPTRDRAGWWTRPIFCGWGEQCRTARLEGGHPTEYATQARYDAWLTILADRDIRPGTIVVDDRWQTTYGRNEPDPARWPDLRAWVADRHRDDQRVLLWWKAWDPEGLPADACISDGRGRSIAADPTSPSYRALVTDRLADLLGADGVDADGLKVDFTAQTPAGPGGRRIGAAWGIALLHELLALLHGAAKAAKRDALVITHAASPLFADVTDMVRLNDLMRLDDPDPLVEAVPQMTHRARVAGAIEPGMLIDTDDWCMPSRAEWRRYLAAKPSLGVPALYYATGIDWSEEPFRDEDYAAIRATWAAWEARRLQDSKSS
jgi:hypothetical protein